MASKRRRTPGLVSVVLVNFRGADDTITCIEGLRALEWPADQLEIVCVDNDSGDDSVGQDQDRGPGCATGRVQGESGIRRRLQSRGAPVQAASTSHS